MEMLIYWLQTAYLVRDCEIDVVLVLNARFRLLELLKNRALYTKHAMKWVEHGARLE